VRLLNANLKKQAIACSLYILVVLGQIVIQWRKHNLWTWRLLHSMCMFCCTASRWHPCLCVYGVLLKALPTLLMKWWLSVFFSRRLQLGATLIYEKLELRLNLLRTISEMGSSSCFCLKWVYPMRFAAQPINEWLLSLDIRKRIVVGFSA